MYVVLSTFPEIRNTGVFYFQNIFGANKICSKTNTVQYRLLKTISSKKIIKFWKCS